ncbi:Uncharacterized protein HZ326_21889 [Fusarium oxysporum f. sp. albedinis]|nr:Uncharacterized protein HZ326_22352 [Fusarium oxysporum f. sp. albedinis]KAJ0135080.1 Uncharacterized protein HZ326_21889 [Fusarium oxysporum f. sp. albedinis]
MTRDTLNVAGNFGVSNQQPTNIILLCTEYNPWSQGCRGQKLSKRDTPIFVDLEIEPVVRRLRGPLVLNRTTMELVPVSRLLQGKLIVLHSKITMNNANTPALCLQDKETRVIMEPNRASASRDSHQQPPILFPMFKYDDIVSCIMLSPLHAP